jgi:hypothetical protein
VPEVATVTSLTIMIAGQPQAGGGVAMSASAVALGSASQASLYRGSITQLQGTSIGASVADAAGNRLSLAVQLTVAANGGVSGTLTAAPA